MKKFDRKSRVALLSIGSNTMLIILKVVAGILSGSVSIISEAIHSFMDLLASIIAFFSVKISDTPADERHPYGHGKFENVSGVIEAVLIFAAAFWIIYEAIKKMLKPGEIENISYGFIVMLISAIINFIVSRKLYKVAKETESIALEADALHLKTDVYTSAGVAFGLLLIWITGYHRLDPVIAILVALLILKEAVELFLKAYSPLLDVSLSHKELERVKSIIQRHCMGKVSYHGLRSRKAGNYNYLDFHLNLPENLTVKEAHQICDTIENDIKSNLKNTEVTIHVENF